MFEKFFSKKIESGPNTEQKTSKEAEKFLKEEKKKEEFAKIRFEELEQERERLKQMPSSEETLRELKGRTKPGKDFVKIPRSEMATANEQLRRDEDLLVVEVLLGIKEYQEMFKEYKQTVGVKLFFDGDPNRKRNNAGTDSLLHMTKDGAVREKALKELGVNIEHDEEEKILEELEVNKEKVFSTDFPGMELVFSHRKEDYKPIGQDKVIKDEYREILVRFYDAEERDREMQKA